MRALPLAVITVTLAALAGVYATPTPARSCDCLPPGNHGEWSYDDPTRAADAIPWISVVSDDLDRLSAASCRLEPTDAGPGEAVPVTPILPEAHGALESEGGCSGLPDDRFRYALVRLDAGEQGLAPNTTYLFTCDLEDTPARNPDFRTGAKTAAPPPAITVTDPTRFSYECCGEQGNDRLAVRLGGLTDAFFIAGGVVEVTYPDGRVDWIGDLGYAETDVPASVSVELPAEDHDTLEFTAVNAAGERGEPVSVSVSGLGGAREFGCRQPRRHGGEALALLFVAGLALRSRRRRA